MNPVFLRVVPAANTRGEQGTQATAATVACQKILLINLVVVHGPLDGNGAQDTFGGAPDTPVHLIILVDMMHMVHQTQLVHQTLSCLEATRHFFAHPMHSMQVYMIRLLQCICYI